MAVPLPHPGIHGSLAHRQIQARKGQGRPKVSEGQAGWGAGTAGPFLDLGSGQWVAQQHPRPSAEALFRLRAQQVWRPDSWGFPGCLWPEVSCPSLGRPHPGYFGSLSSEPGPVAFIPELLEIWSEMWSTPLLSRICPVPRAPPGHSHPVRVEWAATAPCLASCCSQALPAATPPRPPHSGARPWCLWQEGSGSFLHTQGRWSGSARACCLLPLLAAHTGPPSRTS